MFKKKEEDFVENLDSSRRIASQFIISNKEIKRAKSGRKYLDFTLSDKTGQIVGRNFPESSSEEIFDAIEVGGIYRILGNVNEFPRGSGKFNIIINTLNQLSEEEYDLEDYIRASGKNKEQLFSEIIYTIKNFENDSLKQLLKSFFCDKKFTEEFCKSPSAMYHHHNYIGGLLEHTVEVLDICKATCKIFPELNKDLLYTGAILHDIGKMETYDYDMVSINYSEKGELLDHLFISADRVKDRIKEINMPEELADQVLHLILSHHGEVRNGWGSPVSPKTPEAVALHYADNLDAQVKGILQK
ncbi:MAG: HD domain-containing protein [Methanobacteriaceae archaeon]|jgi:3'-5' exoribonuclease|nr:HD domain-containing protein [Methanobacteriaceae archaeon]